MRSSDVTVGQVMDLLSKLAGQVSWGEYQKQELQGIIDSVVLSGAHFREFIHRGGRIPLGWIPLEFVASQEINIAIGSWGETKALSQRLIGEHPNYFRFQQSINPNKPAYWEPRANVIVSLLRLTDSIVHKTRLLEFFSLLNVRSSTFLEAFAAIRGWEDRKVFDQGVFLLDAQRSYDGAEAGDVQITPSWLCQEKYHEVVESGDIDDGGCFGNHRYFMVTNR